MWGRCSRRGEGDAGEVLEEEDAREVKKHNACVLGVRWGEVGRVKKKTTSILAASIRSGRARYCSQMCSFMKSLDLVVLFTSSVVPVCSQGGSQVVCQSDRRRGQRPRASQLPSRCDGASFFASLPNTHTNTHHRQVPMGKLKVHVAVRTWGLPAMLDTLTMDVEDGVSEGSFKVRMVMMLLLVGVMRATIVWRGWALPTQDEILGIFSC